MPLPISEIRQIAGRAGRYRTVNQDLQKNVVGASPPANAMGLVTTLDDADLPMVQHALTTEPKPISTAGLFPPLSVVQRFSASLPPETPFSHVLLHLHELSQLHPRFHLCLIEENLRIAQLIDSFKGLSVEDRLIFCAAPTRLRVEGMENALLEFARCVGEHKSGKLLDIPNLPLDILEQEPTGKRDYLQKLENLHLILVLYIWLSFRFASVFVTRALAVHVKEMVEQRIDQALAANSLKNNSKQNTKLSTQSQLRDKRDSTRSLFGASKGLTHSMVHQRSVPKSFLSGQQLPVQESTPP